ncbi:MAG TPA: DUF2147 domain-containing protein [Acetobacteraceae bacterium]|nr:DUF2147 domain-containing protein [Acetobacteraceae bacterium]
MYRYVFSLSLSLWLACWAVAFAVLLAATAAIAAPETGPQGDWLTANRGGVVEIESCGAALCGRIVGIDRAPAEPMPTDVHGQSQCGLTIISGEKPDGPGTWLGEITDPRDGNSYQAKLWVDGRGNLRLRAFIGVPALGATQVWHRFAGHLDAACRFA